MPRIDDLIERLRALEAEVRSAAAERRDDLRGLLVEKRLAFSQDVVALQPLRVKQGLVRYLAKVSPLSLLATLVIWSGIVPLVLLDLFLLAYQAVCFPAYGIPKVKRSEYVFLDRTDLPYLNAIEKLNCAYCGYANGLAAYLREIAARTEQYWCPIKHARKIVAAHDYYHNFFEYGDAESWRLGLERLRSSLAELDE